jgi:hypothetical protein
MVRNITIAMSVQKGRARTRQKRGEGVEEAIGETKTK